MLLRGALLVWVLCIGSWSLADPGWWSDPGTKILVEGSYDANDHAPANIGQLKHVASMAKAYLDAELVTVGGAGAAVEALFPFSQSDNYAPVNVGQLKNVAKPFYDRFNEVGYAVRDGLIANGFPESELGTVPPVYPWDPNAPAAENDAPVNIGQLKMVFSFDLSGFVLESGDPWEVLEEIKLNASDGNSKDYFGYALDHEGDRLIVGTFRKASGGLNYSGRAYIYEWEQGAWSETASLVAWDAAAFDYFGYCVAVAGEWAAVGAIYDDDGQTNSGSVYLFKKEGVDWIEKQKIQADVPLSNGRFGSAVDLSDEELIVGSYGADSYAGRAYIFRREGESWSQAAELGHPEVDSRDYFGYSVSISDEVAVVGAYRDEVGSISVSGAAYVFRKLAGNWVTEERIVSPNPGSSEYFGFTVGVSGPVVVVGAFRDSESGISGAGAAHVYRYQTSSATWQFEETLLASDAAAYDSFGSSVSIYDDTIAVGAYGSDPLGSYSGAGYLFRYDESSAEWVERKKVVASDGSAGDYLGYRHNAVSQRFVVFGALGDDDLGSLSGSAYVYALPFTFGPPVMGSMDPPALSFQEMGVPLGEVQEFFPDAVPMELDWFDSEWFGEFYAGYLPWIYCSVWQVWLYLSGDAGSEEGLYLYDDFAKSWLWTKDDVYPAFYSFDLGAWLWYVEGSNPRTFIQLPEGNTVIFGDGDSDGLPDLWETQYFGQIENQGSTDDSDLPSGDGYSNLTEYLLGTDPTEPAVGDSGQLIGLEVVRPQK